MQAAGIVGGFMVNNKAALLALLVASLVTTAHAEEFSKGDYHFSTGDEPAFVHRADVPSTWPAGVPGADDQRWRYWLYDVQIDHRGGRERTYVDHVFEPRSVAMLGDAGRFEIDFNPDCQTLAIHRVEVRRDGKWTTRLNPARISLARREGEFENDVSNGAVSALVVLDDVRVGDLVRIAYTIEGANPVLAGQRLDGYHVGYRNPALDVRWRALYDPGTRLAVRGATAKYAPRIDSRADGVEASLARQGVAAVQDYGNYPGWHDPYPWIQVGPEQGWHDVAKWATALYPAVTAPLPADLEARVAQWRRLPAPVARMTAALRAVQDEVRYFGIEMGEGTHRPQPPSETWTRRFGDCKDKAYLLATLLGRLDIKAVPALVSADDGKAVADFVPSASDFDHVIVRATIDGHAVWLDPTIAQQGGDPRAVDLSVLGVGLPIAPDSEGLEKISRPANARDEVASVERFGAAKADGPVSLDVETTYHGALADAARASLIGQRPEDLSRRYTEYYGKRYPKVEAVQAPTIEDDRAADELRVQEHYRLAMPFTEEGDGVRALSVFAEPLDKPLQLPDSMTHPGPLHVGMPGVYRYRVEVDAPAAWNARFGLEAQHRESAAFALDRNVTVEGSRAKLDYVLDLRARDLEATDVDRHLSILRAARDDLSAALRYQVPATLDTRQREDRLKALLRDAVKTGGAQ
ncbi:DUF3857 domain-containing transglutaminase family protein [Cognatilysobacter lacus]|uniref:DUF3857 domain-containing protein n=1 Tax=Cognatilysobacter lacus TaxID=1643323 RepID=A0A5D8Z9D5_9GAMM|nr:DUF3857 domain-containing protein [Lysobacter lacus]TZF90663.1 DUF3857 domain-containing protein [Lysobacter lacus]